MPLNQPNELSREYLGLNGINPFPGTDSSPRAQMFATHLSQTLVIKGSSKKYIQTGMEREFGKYTFSIKMPVDAQVIRLVDRYKKTIGANQIMHNPQSAIIYEDINTREVGIVDLPQFCSHHQHFGFEYIATEALQNLRKGSFVAAGTILLNSPSVDKENNYKFGKQCNVAFMSHPSVAEDGIIASREILEEFAIKTYETRIVEFGSNRFPLNLYGTLDNFKAFPDIGEYIREDGILMATRDYDPLLAPIQQNIHDLMDIDYSFDKLVYANGPGGRIIDIKVHHNNRVCNPPTPMGMEVQATKYDNARRMYYSELLSEYNRLRRERGDDLKITPQFHRLLVEAMSVMEDTDQTIIMMNGKNPLDDWRIEFVLEYITIPREGFKFSETHGGQQGDLFIFTSIC